VNYALKNIAVYSLSVNSFYHS